MISLKSSLENSINALIHSVGTCFSLVTLSTFLGQSLNLFPIQRNIITLNESWKEKVSHGHIFLICPLQADFTPLKRLI
jgi:hypothetical protein